VGTSKRRKDLGSREIVPLDARAARVAALDALARRDYASEDLRRKLLQKGYDSAVIALLIDQLSAEKLLDDRRYAENFVAYHAARGQGPLRVRAELRRKGLEGVLVEECLEAYPEWLSHLRKARQKKFGATPPSNYADQERQSRFLAYRGFTGAQIRTALGVDVAIDSDSDFDTDTDT
jgi:regulatory protein